MCSTLCTWRTIRAIQQSGKQCEALMRIMTIRNSWKFSHGVNVEHIPYIRAIPSKVKSIVAYFLCSMSRRAFSKQCHNGHEVAGHSGSDEMGRTENSWAHKRSAWQLTRTTNKFRWRRKIGRQCAHFVRYESHKRLAISVRTQMCAHAEWWRRRKLRRTGALSISSNYSVINIFPNALTAIRQQ